MSKLHLYISRSVNSYKSLINFNPAEDVRSLLTDQRAALKDVDYDPAVINVFYLVNYSETGVLFTILRTIPSTPGNHLAAAIFIPYCVEISSDRILEVIDEVKKRITRSGLDSKEIDELRSLFSTDYPDKEPEAAHLCSAGREYAHAFFGGEDEPALREYADTGFYLPAFAEYSGVLLIGADSDVTATSKDVTPRSFPKLFALNPPARNTDGFVPYIRKSPFDKPYLLPANRPLIITWHRNGFEDIKQTITPTGPSFEIPVPDTGNTLKTISPASFQITSQRTQDIIDNATITVNEREIDGPVSFTCAELRSAQITIAAKGYFSYSGRVDLVSTTRALVQLRELRKIYRFELPVNTPEPVDSVHFTIQSKQPLKKCPIDGYTVGGDGLTEGASHTNSLIFTGSSSKSPLIKLIATGVAGIVIGLLCGWLIGSCSHNTEATPEQQVVAQQEEIPEVPEVTATAVIPENLATVPSSSSAEPAAEPAPAAEQPTPEPQVVEQPAPAAAPANGDYSAAIAYLDNNKKWKRSEMEAISGLAGLFEALNNYEFDKIKTEYARNLSSSSRFSELLRSIEGSVTKRDPRTERHAPTYCRQGDDVITVFAYRCWIDP